MTTIRIGDGIMSKEKISFVQLCDNKNWKDAVLVFKQESFTEPYTETERSYKVNSDAKYFDGDMIGSSLYGNCLDGIDLGVRLDGCMYYDNWEVDYCYITKWKEEGI